MKKIKNKEAFHYIRESGILLDSEIIKIELLNKDGLLNIDLSLKIQSGSDLLIEFIRVSEYSFYYSDNYIFYIISSVKNIMKDNNLYYFSLDPADESELISKNDKDIIICHELLIHLGGR